MRRSTPFIALGVSILCFSACTSASARTVVATGENPKGAPTAHSLKSLRDSIYHSYLDSLDLRIETLNRAAKTIDSVARSLRSHPSMKLHVNGHCFGPIQIPRQTVGGDSVWIETPEINIPEIEIPDFDIDVPNVNHDGGTLYRSEPYSRMDSYSQNLPSVITGFTSSEEKSYYYSSDGRRYYIKNTHPRHQAKRASSTVWLLDGK